MNHSEDIVSDKSPNSSGDSEFVALLTAYQGNLLGFLNSLLPGDPEVLDILQKTTLILWERRGEYRADGNFKAWSLAIAYWEARAWMTSCKRKAWLIFDDELAQAALDRFVGSPHEDHQNARQSLIALRTCLTKLRDSDRLIIVEYYQYGKSLSECGRVLGRNADSLKVSLVRIRASLRQCIEAKLSLGRAKS